MVRTRLEAFEPFLDVGEEAGLRELAVGDDIDAAFGLLCGPCPRPTSPAAPDSAFSSYGWRLSLAFIRSSRSCGRGRLPICVVWIGRCCSGSPRSALRVLSALSASQSCPPVAWQSRIYMQSQLLQMQLFSHSNVSPKPGQRCCHSKSQAGAGFYEFDRGSRPPRSRQFSTVSRQSNEARRSSPTSLRTR